MNMRLMILIMLVLSAKISFAETPWYVGAGVGASNFAQDSTIDETSSGDLDIDSMEIGFSLFGGYQFNERWAVEFGYIDFGKTEDYDPEALALEMPPGSGNIVGYVGEGLKYETAGIYLNGQYHIPLSNSFSFDLVGGWLFSEAKAKQIGDPDFPGPLESASYDDDGAMLGLALTWQMSRNFGLRGNANYYLVDYDNTTKHPIRLGADIIWNF